MDNDPSVTADDIARYTERARLDSDWFDLGEQAAAMDTQDDIDEPTPLDREYMGSPVSAILSLTSTV